MATDIVGAAPAGIGSYPMMATGSFVGSGNPASLTCGFNPRRVTVIDETGGKVYTKLQGNSPNTCVVNGAIDTSGLMLFPADVGLNEPGSTVLLSPNVCTAGSKIAWCVEG